MADYSLADIRSIVDAGEGHEEGMFGGNAFLWVILIFLFFLAFSGGNGIFGNNNTNGMAQVERDVLTSSCATQKEVLESRYDNALQLAQLGYQNQLCCCDLKTAIHAEGEQTRALIQANTVQELRDRLALANDAITSQTIANNVINSIRPVPVPAYLTCSPYTAYNFGYGNNCGCCNCGCGCNNLV